MTHLPLSSSVLLFIFLSLCYCGDLVFHLFFISNSPHLNLRPLYMQSEGHNAGASAPLSAYKLYSTSKLYKNTLQRYNLNQWQMNKRPWSRLMYMVIVGKLFQWPLNVKSTQKAVSKQTANCSDLDLEDNDTSGHLELFIIIFFRVVIGKSVKFWSYHISYDHSNKHNKALWCEIRWRFCRLRSGFVTKRLLMHFSSVCFVNSEPAEERALRQVWLFQMRSARRR